MLELFLFLLFIGLFIYGMFLFSKGLFNFSGQSLNKWLFTITGAPWKGLIIGALVTAVLNSSSAVMIITIGLISARKLTFPQAIGIILGTNIGTTVDAEIITLDIDSLIIPMAVIGGVFALIKGKILRSSGFILLGLAAVFGAMWGFEYLASSLLEMEFINRLLLTLGNNSFYAVLAGIVIAGMIQSSSATVGITMGFLTSGVMELDTAVAIMLGANIGTCVDVLFAGYISRAKESLLTAWAHVWINILGVAVFFPFIGWLTDLGQLLSSHPDVQLAHVSVIFNVLVSLLFLPFTNQFAKFILKIHDRKKNPSL
ncbi:TPA: Na/Pi cotransporter family protein [Bacillus pseudomycoides]|nr:Na/Pi cotransporter family protein [Bacillus pseudomycoides]